VGHAAAHEKSGGPILNSPWPDLIRPSSPSNKVDGRVRPAHGGIFLLRFDHEKGGGKNSAALFIFGRLLKGALLMDYCAG